MSGCDTDCKIESIVTIDAKGQIVLPKNIRERAGFKPHGKLALLSFEKEGKVCCVIVIKAESLEGGLAKTLSLAVK